VKRQSQSRTLEVVKHYSGSQALPASGLIVYAIRVDGLAVESHVVVAECFDRRCVERLVILVNGPGCLRGYQMATTRLACVTSILTRADPFFLAASLLGRRVLEENLVL
jgi:hypothetical protein